MTTFEWSHEWLSYTGLIVYSKMHPVWCTNTHHVTDLVNHGMFKNAKIWITWKRNITFPQNKKILNLCFTWHILRSYSFVVEVAFKANLEKSRSQILNAWSAKLRFSLIVSFYLTITENRTEWSLTQPSYYCFE